MSEKNSVSDQKNILEQLLLLLSYDSQIKAGDDSIVYKLCYDITGQIDSPDFVDKKTTNREWMVIMQKLKKRFGEGLLEPNTDSTQTNESRNEIIDKSSAKFRANKLKVLKIINVNNLKSISTIINKYKTKTLKYKVGEIVESKHYDEEINNICSDGIHYFKTLIPAYYYRHVPDMYTGKWITYYDNGQKESEGKYYNEQKTGYWITWYENGQKETEGNYINGIRENKWTIWYENGEKITEGCYVKGKKSGNWTAWHDNGKKETEGNYDNDVYVGKWKVWHYNGNISNRCEFVNGKQAGRWIEYNCDGKKEAEREYFRPITTPKNWLEKAIRKF